MYALTFLAAAGNAVASCANLLLPVGFAAPGRVAVLTLLTFLVLLTLAIVIALAVRALASERSRNPQRAIRP